MLSNSDVLVFSVVWLESILWNQSPIADSLTTEIRGLWKSFNCQFTVKLTFGMQWEPRSWDSSGNPSHWCNLLIFGKNSIQSDCIVSPGISSMRTQLSFHWHSLVLLHPHHWCSGKGLCPEGHQLSTVVSHRNGLVLVHTPIKICRLLAHLSEALHVSSMLQGHWRLTTTINIQKLGHNTPKGNRSHMKGWCKEQPHGIGSNLSHALAMNWS